jgi:hypothetical protein
MSTITTNGRPQAAAAAMAFAGAALTLLIAREALAVAAPIPVLAASLVVLACALVLGARLAGWRLAGHNPAGLTAPVLGALALALPSALLAARLGASLSGPLAGLGIGLGLLGLVLGVGLAVVRAACLEAGTPRDRALLVLAGGLVAGTLFAMLIVVPKLSPLNACLDCGIGCAAVGIICAAAGPPGRRAMETWLSVLALVFVIMLPLSSLVDAQTAVYWCAPASQNAAPAKPAP